MRSRCLYQNGDRTDVKANKTYSLLFLSLLFIGVSAVLIVSQKSRIERWFDENDPDRSPTGVEVDFEDYIRARTEYIEMLRGGDTATPGSRARAIRSMERSERRLNAAQAAGEQPTIAGAWTPIGPAPVPINGSTAYSGRTVSIAVHPTNPNIVYAGAAQGGLYRSLNGGATWTPLMDNALSLAIGAIAIAPSSPSTIYVGTGESGLCGSGCFAGAGLYRIDNADTNPVLSNVITKNSSGADVFTGRAVSRIVIDPSNANNVFVGTTSGIAGIGANTTGLSLPNAGLYRSTNGTAGDPRFDQVTINGLVSPSRAAIDVAADPGDINRLLVAVIGSGGDGGIYLTTTSLSASPTFTRTFTTGDGSTLGRTELAVNRSGSAITVYAASGTASGTLYKSTDGGATFNPTAAQTGFCSTQCFYDLAVAVDPTNPNNVFVGGSPSLVFGRSTNGAASTLTNNSANLHVDTQVITVAPSDPNTVYFGSDGGIWKTTNVFAATITWTTLNNSTYSATEFMGLATHPVDRNYTLGGTQDNGTEFFSRGTTSAPSAWFNSRGGDGGFAVIDQNSTTGSVSAAYHTFYNQTTNQIGYERATTVDGNGDPVWQSLRGCTSGTSNNGINCADSTLFYAPMVRGPGNPNTLYFGTNHLYRSSDQGMTMTDVSGALGVISAIGIAPQDDSVRLVGTSGGQLYRSTTAGATTMTNVTGTLPARYVGRIAIDPANANIAYVAMNGYGIAGGHVYKTTNLLTAGTPTWTASGLGIPDVPANALAIDPSNSQVIYCGTDIGVFRSSDAGASWIPFSNGLPRVAVFGMEIQQANRVLRIATHGRGMWDYDLAAVRQHAAFDYDGDNSSDVSIFRPSDGYWWIAGSAGGLVTRQFGMSGDKLAPADYDGDGKADIAVYRPSEGVWYIVNSQTGTITISRFGLDSDIPAPADFDGDGRADITVWRPSDGTWWINTPAGLRVQQWGMTGDAPVVGDYDGDGKSDIAVFRPSTGVWWVQRSTAGLLTPKWGMSTDKVTPADFDGDGKTDPAIYRSGQWWVLTNTATGAYVVENFGNSADIPAAADYDGDGRADIAIFRPSDGSWWMEGTTRGLMVTHFGMTADQPTENAYGN
jgi:hypothetical protein